MTFTAEALIKALTVAPDHEAAFRAAALALHRDPGLKTDPVVMISLRNRVAVALGDVRRSAGRSLPSAGHAGMLPPDG